MYSRPVRRGAALGLAGAHARQVPASRHDGSYTEFLRRHEAEAKQATLGTQRDRERFAATLLERAGDSRNVMLAIEHCASRGKAAGPNGLQPTDLDDQAQWALARELGATIRDGTHSPGGIRTIMIDKGGNRGQRPIRIQNFEDRVAERAILQVVRPLTEPQYLESSLGFRNPGRSREEALATAERIAQDQSLSTWIAEDLANAFEMIPTSRLMQAVRRMIPADPICNLISRLATQRTGRGIRQGGPLSPELLNIYLHWILDRWWAETFPHSPMLRVADDLLILTRADDAMRLYGDLVQRTQSIGMPLKGKPWTAVRSLAVGQPVDWLGYRVQRRDNELEVAVAKKSWDKLEDHLRMAWEEPIPPLAAIESIRGWISQQGAAFCQGRSDEMYAGIAEKARNQGFQEIPGREEIASRWQEAYLRDWVRQRREVLLRVRGRSVESADGSADQHGIFATHRRRSGVARSTAEPPQEAPNRPEVDLFCDGACLAGQRVGGWAYLLIDRATGCRQQYADSHPRTTNNRMELTAVIRGLATLPDAARVHLVIDSRYVYDGITSLLPRWIESGWRAGGHRSRRVRNPRLWQRLVEQLERHEVDCQWVRGHASNEEHNLVDRLAHEAAVRAAFAATAGGHPA